MSRYWTENYPLVMISALIAAAFTVLAITAAPSKLARLNCVAVVPATSQH